MTELSGNLVIRATVTASARTRSALGLHHLLAACAASARVQMCEAAHQGEPLASFWDSIFQDCLAVAVLTVAGVESYANELYFDGGVLRTHLNAASADELGPIIEKESILTKFALAVSMATGSKMDRGRQPTQDVATLIELRNAVVHFRSEWHGQKGRHTKLAAKLQNRFERSEFFTGEPLFPRAWASHDFTVWALRAALAFLDYAFIAAGREAPLTKHLKALDEAAGASLSA